jgi:hypothetical protein
MPSKPLKFPGRWFEGDHPTLGANLLSHQKGVVAVVAPYVDRRHPGPEIGPKVFQVGALLDAGEDPVVIGIVICEPPGSVRDPNRQRNPRKSSSPDLGFEVIA